MNCIYFDPKKERNQLLPFTFTRPIAKIRIGILNIDEKWEKHLQTKENSYLTESYLSEKYPLIVKSENLLINGSICPNSIITDEIKKLKAGEALFKNDTLIAANVKESEISEFNSENFSGIKIQTKSENILQLSQVYDIFSKNAQAIEEDFELICAGRKSEPIPEGNQVINPEKIFIEPGAKVLFSILNASSGPIYIGKNAEVMEGCKIRGPFALCEDAGLKMDAKIYGATTVGPHCKVGGEVNNSVFFSYSNKGHDGFVGNAVIGEWVNMGADTNNSNLKNTYDEVKLWQYNSQRFEKTGLTFCGLMMADHAKCGINTMFNTGTVVGVGANVFGSGFPRNFIPDFSWGGAQGFETHVLNKFYKTAEAMCGRRNVVFGDVDKVLYKKLFEMTAEYRFWENKL
jgi:UDP-N-acetylglucosamine diphosphorylase/glucosamine-1-phosphate N-acetyltransferase